MLIAPTPTSQLGLSALCFRRSPEGGSLMVLRYCEPGSSASTFEMLSALHKLSFLTPNSSTLSLTMLLKRSISGVDVLNLRSPSLGPGPHLLLRGSRRRTTAALNSE